MRHLFFATIALIATFVVVDVSSQTLPPRDYKIWTVPGYGTLNGTQAESVPSNRTFYSFRSVFYAEKPTNLTRFLVNHVTTFKLNKVSQKKQGFNTPIFHV